MQVTTDGKKLMKELRTMDEALSKGESISKSHMDSVLAQLGNVASLALKYPTGQQIYKRTNAVVAKVKQDLDNPELFVIEGDTIRRKMSQQQEGKAGVIEQIRSFFHTSSKNDGEDGEQPTG